MARQSQLILTLVALTLSSVQPPTMATEAKPNPVGVDILYGNAPHTDCRFLTNRDSKDYLQGYESGRLYALSNRTEASAPFNTLSVYLDSNGVGYLRSPQVSELYSRTNKEGLLFFLKPKGGWTQLSLPDAKVLWGSPREHASKSFYTFDAESEEDGEKNVYHLDLKFKNHAEVVAYRVRGIGISSPKWVSENTDLSQDIKK